LTARLGAPGESTLSDDELIQRIRGVLDDLDRKELVEDSDDPADAVLGSSQSS